MTTTYHEKKEIWVTHNLSGGAGVGAPNELLIFLSFPRSSLS